MIYGVERTEDGRVVFTSWFSVLWMPVFPLASWSAVYSGELPPNGMISQRYCLADPQRIRHDWRRNGQTFVAGLLLALAAVAPRALLMVRSCGRGATSPEVVAMFASLAWAMTLIFGSERHRRRKLQGDTP